MQALMVQLREKESQLNQLSQQHRVALQTQQITEQTNLQLKVKVEQHNRAVAERDTRIAVLEQKLSQERKGNGSAIVEANLAHLKEKNAEHQRLLTERDAELSQLRPLMKDLMAKVEEFEHKGSVQHANMLEEELAQLRIDLAVAKDQGFKAESLVEELEKKVKGKEWMIKSLQEESEDQRSRESHLMSHIKTLTQKVETYESKFNGGGIDVPMLLAKLKDYEVRTKDLQGQVRRLTNKKLNELVLRSSPIPHGKENDDTAAATSTKSKLDQDDGDNDSVLFSDNDSFLVNSIQDDDGTFMSNVTDDMYDQYAHKSNEDEEEDVLSDFISDVKVGIETLEMGSLCCQHRPSPVLSPTDRVRDDSNRPRSRQSSRRR